MHGDGDGIAATGLQRLDQLLFRDTGIYEVLPAKVASGSVFRIESNVAFSSSMPFIRRLLPQSFQRRSRSIIFISGSQITGVSPGGYVVYYSMTGRMATCRQK